MQISELLDRVRIVKHLAAMSPSYNKQAKLVPDSRLRMLATRSLSVGAAFLRAVLPQSDDVRVNEFVVL